MKTQYVITATLGILLVVFGQANAGEKELSQNQVPKAVMDAFGGGEIVGVTGVEGNSTDMIRSRGRDAAIAEFPKIKLAGELPGKWNREDSQKAMEDLISRFPNLKGVIGQNDDVADGCIAALRAAGLDVADTEEDLMRVFVPGSVGGHGDDQRKICDIARSANAQIRHLKPSLPTLEDVFARAIGEA